MKNGDMPAIGHAGQTDKNGFADAPGLTKRELFAAMAMQGFAAVPCPGGVTNQAIAHDVGSAVLYADALLAELERTA